MFTGLIEGLGQVVRVALRGPDAELAIRPPWPNSQVVIGESVAVNGACLTVTKLGGDGFTLDVSGETLEHTTLGGLQPGNQVNLERALKMGDRLGGHLVTGHVDCVGIISRVRELGSSTRMFITIPGEHLKYVVQKGSVALNGISLTVNQVDEKGFELNLIPHTWQLTTLKLARQGDSVNIETDLIGKYVARLLKPDQPQAGAREGLSREDLARLGF